MNIEIKSLHVAGVQFRPGNVIDALTTGMSPRLVAEPENKYDPFAIKVEAFLQDSSDGSGTWHHIGYIPKKDTWIFHILRKAGVKLYTKIFVNHDALDPEKIILITSVDGDPNAAFL